MIVEWDEPDAERRLAAQLKVERDRDELEASQLPAVACVPKFGC